MDRYRDTFYYRAVAKLSYSLYKVFDADQFRVVEYGYILGGEVDPG